MIHECKSLGIVRESPVKCVCGSSTNCIAMREDSLWRYWKNINKPYYQWFCKTTGCKIDCCSITTCHTTLIGRYEHYKNEIEKNVEEMWKLLQHFSGIEGR